MRLVKQWWRVPVCTKRPKSRGKAREKDFALSLSEMVMNNGMEREKKGEVHLAVNLRERERERG